jgi:LysM repeat protein
MAENKGRQEEPASVRDGNGNICPFLGFIDDPETAISYPSKMNCCNHTRPVTPVSMEYQREMCLTSRFIECPIYQRVKLAPLPQELQESAGFWDKLKPVIPFIALVLVLVIGFLASVWMGVLKIPGMSKPPATQAVSTTSVISSPTTSRTVIPTNESTPSEIVKPTASETTVLPTNANPHYLETVIGESPSLIIHKVLDGEGYIWLAQNYNTSEEAIKAINYNLPESLWVNTILVIPVDTSDVADLPQFSAYMIEGENVTIERMAELLRLDAETLKTYNDLPEGYVLVAGEWLLIPH